MAAAIIAIAIATPSARGGDVWDEDALRRGPRVVFIEGVADCGAWVSSRPNQSGYLEHFVLGLMNGLSMGHGVEFWRADGRKVSRAAVYLWMDKYCREHPLDLIVTGAAKLYEERSG